MVRYLGPRLRILRRFALPLPGLTKKTIGNRDYSPGEHGKLLFFDDNHSSLKEDYKNRLLEKQRLRFNYGITEKQLISYFKEAKKYTKFAGYILLEFIEARLDCIVYRLGFASTIPAARQIINHKHILVNNKLVDIPSFICKKNDIITIKNKIQSKKLITTNFEIQQKKIKVIQNRMKNVYLIKYHFRNFLPKHLKINNNNDELIGYVISRIKRIDVLIDIDEFKILEYYSN